MHGPARMTRCRCCKRRPSTPHCPAHVTLSPPCTRRNTLHPAPCAQDVLRRLLDSDGRGEDVVKLEAQKLLNAFHINVLL